MINLRKPFWQKQNNAAPPPPEPVAEPVALPLEPIQLDIAPNDPLLAYVQQSTGVLDVNRLHLDSPAVQQLRQAGIQMVIPLVSQGELIGLINLTSRRSEQEYTSDDYKLLADLAVQAAPALRVAQLVHQQKLEAAARERIEQELRVAKIIQQTLLPQELPTLPNWKVNAYYQPARAVGGDFYDFIYFEDGHVAFIIGDVTDKGVPAALVMATTRAILRAAAERLESPGAVLERTNNVLVKEIPAKMFVTCFFAILNPQTGHLRYANAGHDVPYHATGNGVVELRATGMPLGLLPGMHYEEKETTVNPGEYVLLHSDGLVEAHNPQREMFGFPRLQALMGQTQADTDLNAFMLAELTAFTGAGWEQEDDVTLVTLHNLTVAPATADEWQSLASFTLPSAPGNEREAMEQVAAIIAPLPLTTKQVDRLKTAVAEATMNAMEHGNQYDPEKPALINVSQSANAVRICITDQGGGPPVPTADTPDLEAKLAGTQSPRGWGLFLIKNMVDEMHIHHDDHHHTIELIVHWHNS